MHDLYYSDVRGTSVVLWNHTVVDSQSPISSVQSNSPVLHWPSAPALSGWDCTTLNCKGSSSIGRPEQRNRGLLTCTQHLGKTRLNAHVHTYKHLHIQIHPRIDIHTQTYPIPPMHTNTCAHTYPQPFTLKTFKWTHNNLVIISHKLIATFWAMFLSCTPVYCGILAYSIIDTVLHFFLENFFLEYCEEHVLFIPSEPIEMALPS